ncbi:MULTISPECIES: 4-phosphoerythronate dehydrogenase [Pseudidiomarina]|uniref:Erythronate-4-phosphate dehydrogenase n=1 Tax=Pseudidiomarina homiensis TaxID=364198 RepID=A0A432Y545_9GAMM|nr:MULTISPECIES: 4-phosphoerythronate dehydrogenase [Pseudidiomarina]RUO56109.1 4-phosphoerythronate dehydrogenase [Pseudidiomarina homiensis]
MLLVADANLPGFTRLIEVLNTQASTPLEVSTYSERQPPMELLARADALFIRSVTTVDAGLLAHAPNLKWLGTATIGTDHVDRPALKAAGIRFHNCPGVNANAVGDYVVSAVAALSLQNGSLPNGEVAIVGAGNTGTAAGQRLTGLGLKVHYYDPPLVAQGATHVHADWQRVLASQVISFHVPLVTKGEHATHHLFDARALETFTASEQKKMLINASRGPVIDEQALLTHLREDTQLQVVLDVWEHEPQLHEEVVKRVSLATPHIAGHSFAGKLGGSWQLLKKWLTDQGLALQLPSFQRFLQSYAQGQSRLQHAPQAPDWQTLAHWVLQVYDIRQDDQLLRQTGLTATEFDALRRNYAVRAELSQLHLQTGTWAQDENWRKRLTQLTFQIE